MAVRVSREFEHFGGGGRSDIQNLVELGSGGAFVSDGITCAVLWSGEETVEGSSAYPFMLIFL